MMKNGYLTEKDVVGSQHFMDANGNVSVGTVINLRNINFGGMTINNVRASVVPNQKAPLLLGQSVLNRLGKIEIDNQRKVIIITGKDYIGNNDKVYDVVDEMPSFPGGITAMMEWLSANIRYPEMAQKNKIQGKVIIQFVVDENGYITEPEVIQKVEPSLDAEAMRVVLSMPRWKPGSLAGNNIKVKFTLPINFRLT